jgi:fumarate hydratase class II
MMGRAEMGEEKRIERDSLGEVEVPREALWGAQTQRALLNFDLEGACTFPRVFIRALGLIKAACAKVNGELGLLDGERARAVSNASEEVARGRWDGHFPVVIYQTGSGTSTNMNANEVIAHLASRMLKREDAVHPNDHVNMCQSSNDVIPSALHLSAYIETEEILLPGLERLARALEERAREHAGTVKTGRTHLMDALPVTLGQEIGAWAHQVRQGMERIQGTLPRLARLTLGGTAVGTGVNAHPEFGKRTIEKLARRTGLPLRETENHFAAQAAQDTAAELSGQLRATATALMKIADDLRWLNSGPIAGLGEIGLPAVQPGSSIMPGKVNPVICEAMMMVCARVIGNDLTVSIGNSRGNFQLNVMLPIIAHYLLESITLMGGAARVLAERAVKGFVVNRERIGRFLERNPILVTALNPLVGYDKAAEIAKRAYAEGRPVKEVAREMTDLSEEELDRILDPRHLTQGGVEDPLP